MFRFSKNLAILGFIWSIGGGYNFVFASQSEVINTIIEKYKDEDIHLYGVNKEDLTTDKFARVIENKFKYKDDNTEEIGSDEWYRRTGYLHYSNVRTRHAASNRLNKDNKAKWTYEYPQHLNVN